MTSGKEGEIGHGRDAHDTQADMGGSPMPPKPHGQDAHDTHGQDARVTTEAAGRLMALVEYYRAFCTGVHPYHEADAKKQDSARIMDGIARDIEAVIGSKFGTVHDPARVCDGMCPHTIATAQHNGCVNLSMTLRVKPMAVWAQVDEETCEMRCFTERKPTQADAPFRSPSGTFVVPAWVTMAATKQEGEK